MVKGSSQIDYIFSHTVDNLLELEICHQHPTNTSSHVPVVGKIKATLSLTCAKSIKPPERRRNLWKDCDIEAYQSTLSNSQIPIIERPDQIKTFIDQLNGNILAAAKIAVPSKKIRLKGPKWKASPALRQLLVKGNLIHKNWIQYGRPTVNHPIIEERRSIKRRIRSQQRQDMACERKQFYNQIVESGKSTNFYKLIRRGLSNTISKPQGFMNEGQLILDLDKQSKGFARFYEDLAVPKLEQFDSDYHENTQFNLELIQKFYINFLRKIQCLPNRSVKGITYLLLGVRPATAELHIRQLNLLGCIIRSENLTLNKILRRQISTKSETSDSWFTYIDKLLVQYDLPSAAKMVINPPCKLLWKKNVKLAIDKFWTQKLLLDCQNKSTLSYCDLSSLKIGTVHKLWSSIESNIKDVRRGGIKARLITGTYVLQSNTSKFNQHEVSSVCPLCQYEDEDIVHFILKCNALFKYRKSYIEELEVIINSISNPNTCSWNSLVGDFGLLTQLILDPSVLIKQKILSCSEKTLTKIEDCSRKMCFSLHCGRSLIINSEH
ncbi:unnamed protein product [Mytilus edulis]|uniref:Reverse transcriptase zinc-binding domain-containing protein n=1 Tax=Mytilus edulis TaxID=6550 RepID=A0A8S3QE76_MYTED|nr:unnamed protein product [Mytilus edulis]